MAPQTAFVVQFYFFCVFWEFVVNVKKKKTNNIYINFPYANLDSQMRTERKVNSESQRQYCPFYVPAFDAVGQIQLTY